MLLAKACPGSVATLTGKIKVLENSSKTGFLKLSATFVFCLFSFRITCQKRMANKAASNGRN